MYETFSPGIFEVWNTFTYMYVGIRVIDAERVSRDFKGKVDKTRQVDIDLSSFYKQ